MNENQRDAQTTRIHRRTMCKKRSPRQHGMRILPFQNFCTAYAQHRELPTVRAKTNKIHPLQPNRKNAFRLSHSILYYAHSDEIIIGFIDAISFDVILIFHLTIYPSSFSLLSVHTFGSVGSRQLYIIHYLIAFTIFFCFCLFMRR